MPSSLGLDFGTNSVRALLVDTGDGRELATAVRDYPSGVQGILLEAGNDLLARQSPRDYLSCLGDVVAETLDHAERADATFSRETVIGIGVCATGSSPIPVDARNRALGSDEAYAAHLAAQCWLWKDHTAHAEAAEITALGRTHRPHFLAKCGDTYSSEWWWAKLLHCLRTAPEVFHAAASWVELADWIPSVLAGVDSPAGVVRGVCAAGHKALYHESWGGLPDAEFLALLDPELARLRPRLYDVAHDASARAGGLASSWAQRWGLREGLAIGVGAFDVHYGAIGAGVGEGALVKVIGTSTCDCAVAPLADDVADVPGICGIVPGSILPGFYGIEAGQSAVGDLFKWWVEGICQGDAQTHRQLTEAAAAALPGAHGLLALDWNNGNRTVLVDQRLTGLLLGQTLHTSRAEVYRALIEATAFGARVILERLQAYGVRIERVLCAGGIARKNTLAMQIYADVLDRPLELPDSDQTCALGAAMVGAVAGGASAGGPADFAAAQAAMCPQRLTFMPRPENVSAYDQLFALYLQLHDAFGGVDAQASLGQVMKDLLSLKEAARG